MAQLAGHANRASVGFDDGFGDGQSHARSLNSRSLIAPTIKLVENQRLLEIINARTSISDADSELSISNLSSNMNWGVGRRIFCRVFNQVHQYFPDAAFDVAKYFAIIPAMFAATFLALNALNVMHLRTPQSAVLSAVIFNALIIVALIPLALRGVKYTPMNTEALLRRNLVIYGVGGLVAPFIGIKLIDMLIVGIGLVGRT